MQNEKENFKENFTKRLIKFSFEIALKAANETKYWLMVIQESAPEYGAETARLYQEAEELSKILGSSVLTLKGKNKI